MPEEIKKEQPDNEAVENTEGNDVVETTEDEDSVSDDPVGDTTDEEGSEEASDEPSKDDGIDLKTRAILAERELQQSRDRESYLERQAKKAKDEADEQRRLELMSDAEKSQYFYEKTQSFINTQQQQIDQKLRFANFDSQDRAAFINKYGHTPVYNKYAAEIETEYGKAAAKGQVVPRADILRWILGQKAADALIKGAGTKQKNKGAQNVAKVKAKANGSAGKSDFQKSGGFKSNDMSPAAVKARLMAGRNSYNN